MPMDQSRKVLARATGGRNPAHRRGDPEILSSPALPSVVPVDSPEVVESGPWKRGGVELVVRMVMREHPSVTELGGTPSRRSGLRMTPGLGTIPGSMMIRARWLRTNPTVEATRRSAYPSDRMWRSACERPWSVLRGGPSGPGPTLRGDLHSHTQHRSTLVVHRGDKPLVGHGERRGY